MAIVVITLILSTVLWLLKEKIVTSFTSSTDIQTLAEPALVVLALALVPDSIIYAQVGILRGMGK